MVFKNTFFSRTAVIAASISLIKSVICSLLKRYLLKRYSEYIWNISRKTSLYNITSQLHLNHT